MYKSIIDLFFHENLEFQKFRTTSVPSIVFLISDQLSYGYNLVRTQMSKYKKMIVLLVHVGPILNTNPSDYKDG